MKILITIFGALTLVLTTLLAITYFNSLEKDVELVKMNDQITELKKDMAALDDKFRKIKIQNDTLIADKDKDKSEIDYYKNLLAKRNSQANVIPKKVAVKKVDNKNLTEEQKLEEAYRSMAKLYMNNPAMKKEMLKGIEKDIERNYGPLFKELGLSEDQIALVQDHLSKRNAKIMDLIFNQIDNMNLMKGTFKDNATKQLVAQEILDEVNASHESMKNDIKDFNKFEEWDRSVEARKDINRFGSSLGEENKMTADQESQMIKILHSNDDEVFMNAATGNFDANTKSDEDLVQEASTVLNEAQTQSFRTYLDARNKTPFKNLFK